jgi:hypothetical protein
MKRIPDTFRMIFRGMIPRRCAAPGPADSESPEGNAFQT